MKLRYITAASMFAAMAALVGCEQEGVGGGMEEEGITYEEPAGGEDMGTAEDTEAMEAEPYEEETGLAGEGQVETETYTTEPADGMGASEPGMETTEFAALDTNSDGSIDQNEWQPDAVEGMEFDQVDADGDGTINQDEFQQVAGTGGMQQGGQEMPQDQSTPQ